MKEEHSETTLYSDTKEKASIDGVWGSNGRVFITTNEGNKLVVTDSVPRPRWTERYSTITEPESKWRNFAEEYLKLRLMELVNKAIFLDLVDFFYQRSCGICNKDNNKT